MRIQSITIEGFKSYRAKVTLGPLHDGFNAITGENGSGKSNLFDAICFALGYRLGNEMRVETLDDLIYKRGQHGITTATVSITFDNRDKSCSPILYHSDDFIELTRQLSLKGRNRYFVNGSLRKPGEIARMLNEGGLNVGSGNFIVLQGKVQKVVSMKPVELYNMLGETLGTSVFDRERERCEKTLGEKQIELDKINANLKETLEPTYEKCLVQKRNYVSWMNLGVETEAMQLLVERAERLSKETELQDAELRLADCDKTLAILLNQKEQYLSDQSNNSSSIKDLIVEEETLSREFDFEAKQFELAKITREADEADDKVDLLKSEYSLKESAVKTARSILENRKAEFEAYAKAHESFITEEARLTQEREELTATLELAKRTAQAAKLGELINDNGDNVNELLSRLADERTALTAALCSRHSELTFKKERARALKKKAGDSSTMDNLVRELTKMKGDLKSLENDRDLLDFHPDTIIELENEILECRSKQDVASARHVKLSGRFKSEEIILREFPDRRKVPGPLIDCFTIKPGFEKFSLAIEEVVKSRLLHMIVDNDKTANSLFEFAKREGMRITCIPLNRVQARALTHEQRDHARKFNDVLPYDSIIECANEFAAVFSFAFGNCCFADSDSSARNLNNSEGWKLLTVTAQGSTYDPSGRISGGSSVGMSNLINERHEYRSLGAEIRGYGKQLETLKHQHTTLTMNERRYRDFCSAISTISERVQLAESELEYLQSSTSEGELFKLNQDISVVTNQASEVSRALDNVSNDIQILTNQLSVFNSERESRLQHAENHVHTLESRLSCIKSAWTKLMHAQSQTSEGINVQVVEGEISNLARELESLTNSSAEVSVRLASGVEEAMKLRASESSLAKTLETCKARRDDIAAHLGNLKESADTLNYLIKSTELSISQKEAEKLDIQFEVRAARDTLASHPASQRRAVDPDILAKLTSEYSNSTVNEILAALDSRRKERTKLQMSIDMKSIDFLTHLERRYMDFIADRNKIAAEKDSVLELIESIKKRKEAIQMTSHRKLNEILSQIYATLMPDCTAMLELVDKNCMSAGLELNVTFGETSKRSLVDLSGGQKTLLSLSLILSLLKLTPAPFYIFDEIDAALDISHSHNLGVLIKKYFNSNQFIIISHREALFSHSDCIFRTQCSSGTSSIEKLGRTENISPLP